ncbi:myrosinase 1 [Leptinotarsa decemlineata]|uniref:myrosinase 1 n=1 Tax=Leptinotarsa decemlineata TaxID=7539 RepID=UPI003D303F1B
MAQLQLLVVLQLILGTCLTSAYLNSTFPKEFMFGAATAAYQIEGAWNEYGKGESIWDRYVHENPSRIVGEANGDIACDSYHKFKEDVALVAKMGLTTYRFSISWSRIFPTGFKDSKNEDGIKYYQDLISEVETHNLTPIVTLYHWDLPQPIQDLGGWTNTSTVDLFVEYARVVFESFKTVKYWITINEPKQVCRSGYGKGNMAPGIKQSGTSDYKCAYVVLKAHAAAYHLYKTEFKESKGLVSLALDTPWSEPATNNIADVEAVERSMMFDFGLYANPVFIGDWPKIVKERVQNRTKGNDTRLPAFTKAEIDEINGTADFMAVNFYTARLISDVPEASPDKISFENDLRVNETVDPNWDTVFNRTKVPESLRSFLKWLKLTYNNPSIIITENGMADDGSTLNDVERIQYLAEYLNAVLEAIDKDKVRVHGYTYWSLLDNFEWTQGYSQRFGLYYVNFTDPGRERVAKSSVEYYQKVALTRMIFDPTVFNTTTSQQTTVTTPSTSNKTTATTPSTSNQTTATTPSTSNQTTATTPSTSNQTTATTLSTSQKTPTTPPTPQTTPSTAGSIAVSNILLCFAMVLFWRFALN